MHYKTIVLELLQEHQEIRNRLQDAQMLLPTVELYANRLKISHEAWKNRLAMAKPGSSETQITSEALEIAIKEITDLLAMEFPQEDSQGFSIEAAMAFLHSHTRRG